MRMAFEAKANILLEEMRMMYESKATKLLEDLKQKLESSTQALREAHQVGAEGRKIEERVPVSVVEVVHKEVSRLQDQIHAFTKQMDGDGSELTIKVRMLQEHMNSLTQRINGLELTMHTASSRSETLILDAAEDKSSLNEEQIRKIVGRVVEIDVASAETRLQNTIGPLLDKLRSSNSKLGKRLDEVISSSDSHQSVIRELDRRLTQVELAQTRVGTPGAAEWLNTARKELENLGQSLKNCPKVPGQPMAQLLLDDMKKAQLVVQQSSAFAPCDRHVTIHNQAEDPFPIGNGSLGEQGDTDEEEQEARKPQKVSDRGLVLNRALGGVEEETEEADDFNFKTSEAMAKWLLLECNKIGELEDLEEENILDVEGLPPDDRA
jgi:hypothetical protein